MELPLIMKLQLANGAISQLMSHRSRIVIRMGFRESHELALYHNHPTCHGQWSRKK